MKRITLLTILASLLWACESSGPRFHEMTDTELYAYNQGQPMEKQVICRTEADTSTYIRKTKCMTVEEMVMHNEQAAMALSVMDFGRNYNQGIPGRGD